ncbi:hypothetical protein [Labrenzia sp. PHM005]|uniref:hypothetical protein n=1 Tax=Labrenzia sp. PHM005 TaxID=2590016 RepID=UPI0011649091|nr:hypothetical protein [Labrenzia sp. PHM005]QDG79379.1 hypothetical protein FJ695_27915 [Labrenzia sp. PHM005]
MKRYVLSFPVLSILLSLLGSFAVVPLMISSPATNGLKPVGQQNTAGREHEDIIQKPAWLGPRAETKREILIAPLFTKDRSFPSPFSELEENEPEAPDVGSVMPVKPPPIVVKTPQIEEAKPEQPVKAQPLEEQEVPTSDPLVLPDLKLVGTFIAEEMGIARALLVETDEGAEETWVDVKGAYADWILEIVSPEAVLMRGGKETLALELFDEEVISE